MDKRRKQLKPIRKGVYALPVSDNTREELLTDSAVYGWQHAMICDNMVDGVDGWRCRVTSVVRAVVYTLVCFVVVSDNTSRVQF